MLVDAPWDVCPNVRNGVKLTSKCMCVLWCSQSDRSSVQLVRLRRSLPVSARQQDESSQKVRRLVSRTSSAVQTLDTWRGCHPRRNTAVQTRPCQRVMLVGHYCFGSSRAVRTSTHMYIIMARIR